MSSPRAEFIYVSTLFLAALAAHALFAVTPFIFTFPGLLVQTVRHPFWYLVFAGAMAELFSTHNLGVVLAVVMLPLAIRRLLGMVSVDLTLAFFSLVAAMLCLQFIALFAGDAWLAAATAGGWREATAAAVTTIPWPRLPWVLLSALPIGIISILVYFNRTW